MSAAAGKVNSPYTISAGRLVRALQRVRDLQESMTVLRTVSFFYIAGNPGVTQREMLKALGTNDSVASRTLAVLTDRGILGEKGLGLVRMAVNPQDTREKLLYLTPKGERLMEEVLADLGMKGAKA